MIGLYIISATKSLLLTHVTHVAVLGLDPCGMHVATSKTCSKMLCSVYPISWSKLLTSHFPNQRISHSLPPQIARIHKLNAPIFLQKFGHCRLENPPRKRPPKGHARTYLDLMSISQTITGCNPNSGDFVDVFMLGHRFRKRIVLFVWLLRRVGWCVGV